MTKKKKITIAATLAAFIIGVGIIAYFVTRSDTLTTNEKYYSSLTGMEVTKTEAELPVLGIMVENSVQARPQTGLDDAGIVFEALTEGGITRFLALYQENTPEEVGPVRSLRPHFLDLAMGFDASIAHVGGSPRALRLAKERDAKSLNQFTYADPYYRDSNRTAPHNMYVRTNDLRDLQKELGHERSSFQAIPRKNDSPAASPTASEISIDFSSRNYAVLFRYDKNGNAYTRYIAGEPQIDAASNKPIRVKNLIIVKTTDNDTNVIGTGQALVFTDGTVREATWELASYKDRITIKNDEGKELHLNRGDTWIAVVPSSKTVTY